VNPDVLSELALGNAELAAAHHLIFILAVVFLWLRRDLGRVPAVILTLAFGSAAWVSLPAPGARVAGAASAALALAWAAEVVRPRSTLSFEGTSRARVFWSLVAFVYAFVYPGFTPDLPLFVFAPLGVLLPPTVLAALALQNVAAPKVDRRSHWAHVAVGLGFGVWGLALGTWTHAPLVAISLWGAVLLVRGTTRREDVEPEGSVRAIRERMYARKTILPGPGRPGRRFTVGGRGRSGRRR
jgi:hypothetical protein